MFLVEQFYRRLIEIVARAAAGVVGFWQELVHVAVENKGLAAAVQISSKTGYFGKTRTGT